MRREGSRERERERERENRERESREGVRIEKECNGRE